MYSFTKKKEDWKPYRFIRDTEKLCNVGGEIDV